MYNDEIFELSNFNSILVKIFGSTTTELDLTAISPLSGWAWAGQTPTPISGPSVGWIKFSSDTTSSDSNTNIIAGTQKYGVYLNRNTNELMGYAWSGIPCRGDDICGYGWISFNKADFLYKGNYSVPSLQKTEGALIGLEGYAKFMNFGWRRSSFDGYVSLEGVKYDKDQGILTGNTSEVALVPKIHFCDPNNKENPQYCVYVSPKVYPDKSNKPVIQVLEPQSCEGSGADVNCPVKVKFYNPVNYKDVQIKVFSREDNYYNRCINKSNMKIDDMEKNVEECWRTIVTSDEEQSLKERGERNFNTASSSYKFLPKTNYKFLIRALLEE